VCALVINNTVVTVIARVRAGGRLRVQQHAPISLTGVRSMWRGTNGSLAGGLIRVPTPQRVRGGDNSATSLRTRTTPLDAGCGANPQGVVGSRKEGMRLGALGDFRGRSLFEEVGNHNGDVQRWCPINPT
jgi:hypothetical protein